MLIARRSEAAECDLREIAFHIGFRERCPWVADRVVDELIAQAETIAQLSASASMGTVAPEIGQGVRLLSYER
jgi:plasmid stabilization system protein ParE